MDTQKAQSAIDDIAHTCIALRLRLLNRVVTNLFDESLRPLDLNISQLNLLVVTAKLGLAQPAKVCEILQLDTSTLSRNVERMRAKAWLEVVPGEDARTQPFRVTAEGRRLLAQALPAWKVAQQEAAKILGDRGIAALDEAAAKLGFPCAGP
jgi:DNA-binding MarR family transcriptional regulator